MNAYGATILDQGILFPYQNELVEQIALDIGGSLAKVVYFVRKEGVQGGRLLFNRFETEDMHHCLDFLRHIIEQQQRRRQTDAPPSPILCKATGGGAYKFASHLEALGLKVEKEEEMDCLINGLNFLVREIPYEVLSYTDHDPMRFEHIDESKFFPYLLVNIGSGVSLLKVTGENEYERVSGSSLGGGTLWGLLSVLTPAKTFDEMLELSRSGDNRNVDMLVGDIYGGADTLSKFGLKPTTIASSFGKVFRGKHKHTHSRDEYRPQDMAKSLLFMMSNNIGQIAYLNAKLHRITNIYFAGSYIHGHSETMRTLSYAVNFWSGGSMNAYFLRHEGYLGAVGAFLKGRPFVRGKSSSFTENFTRPLVVSTSTTTRAFGSLDTVPASLTVFPLLNDPQSYTPDIVKLGAHGGDEAQELLAYWLDLLERNMVRMTDMALRDVERDDAMQQSIDAFKRVFSKHLQLLKRDPTSYGELTPSRLLLLREQCLHEVGLPDIFAQSKHRENDAALQALPSLLLRQEQQVPSNELLNHLVHGMLAGNMFDWGASPILELVRQQQLTFQSARERIKLSHAYNHLAEFKRRLDDGPPYRKAMVFVDNSGADCILGVLPFVKYLLRQGTCVVLSANSEPAVNDITASELSEVMDRVAALDSTLGQAWSLWNSDVPVNAKSPTLRVIANGNSAPCIDLRRVSAECADACDGVDLVVLEGMGRAVHTNFHSQFKCDSLKVAVVKNERLCKIVGCELYDGVVVFQARN